MSWFDRVRDKPAASIALQQHEGVKILKAAGHQVHGDFDAHTISVDGTQMTVEGFRAFVKGYAMGRLDERTGT